MLTLMLSSALACPVAVTADRDTHPPKDEQRVPGTRVSLQPPVGFEPSSEFAGFEDGAAQIRILEVRRPYEQFLAAHEDDALERRGILVQARTLTKHEGRRAQLLRVDEPRALGEPHSGWMLLVDGGEGSGALRIWARVPTAQVTGGHVRAAMLTARWDPALDLWPLQHLGLKLALPSLEIARLGQTTVVFTRDGEDPTGAEDEAVVRLSRRPLAQPAALVPSVRAGELLEQLAGDRDTLILHEGPVVGLPSLSHHLHAISTGEDPVLHWRTAVWVVDGAVVELTARHPKDAELLRELEGAIRGIVLLPAGEEGEAGER